MSWRRRRVMIVPPRPPKVLALATAALTAAVWSASPAAAAAHPKNETLRFSVPTPVVLSVEHLMSVVHQTTSLRAIWDDALCDAPAEPIPKQVHSSDSAANFVVTIPGARLKSLETTLQTRGCGTLKHDYTTSIGVFGQRLSQVSALSGS